MASLSNGIHTPPDPEIGSEGIASILLQDNFSLHPKIKPVYDICVTNKNITCTPVIDVADTTKQGIVTLLFDDIIGCDCMKGKNEGDVSAYISIYAYPHKRKFASKKTSRQRFCITPVVGKSQNYEENAKLAEMWRRVIVALTRRMKLSGPQDVMTLTLPSPPKLLVLVNPFSGPGKALRIFQQNVVPILAEAGIHFNMIVTERQNHGRDIVKSMKLDDWYGVVIVSGDGLIYEVYQGLMERPDWEVAVKKPVGTIPGGSGNALSVVINYEAGEPFLDKQILHATYVLSKHKVIPMDLVAVDTVKERLYSFLSVAWGIISDVDIESEKYRYLGNARFTVGTLTRIFNLRKYRGRLSFLPTEQWIPNRRGSSRLKRNQSEYTKIAHSQSAQDFQHGQRKQRSHSEVILTIPESTSGFKMPESSSRFSVQESIREGGSGEPELSDIEKVQTPSVDNRGDGFGVNGVLLEEEDGVFDSEAGASSSKISDNPPDPSPLQTPFLNPLDEPVPDDWVSIEDDFIFVLGSFLPYIGPEAKTAPESKLADGAMHLSFVRAPVSRSVLTSIFLSMEDGSHVKNPMVECVKVKAFRLEPLTDKGILTVDGERVDYGPIQAQILPSMARIMGIDQEEITHL